MYDYYFNDDFFIDHITDDFALRRRINIMNMKLLEFDFSKSCGINLFVIYQEFLITHNIVDD